ncbi:MAG: response regulator [Pyrinomonadaceae bacterium]
MQSAQSKTAPGCESSTDGTSQRKTGTLLIVDADTIMRRLMREVLESEGYQVLEARDALDALLIGKSAREHVNLLLTSVALAHMTGLDLFKQLLSVQPGMKVLFISGHLFTDLLRRGLVTQESEFLAKPFPLERLLEKVRRMFNEAP